MDNIMVNQTRRKILDTLLKSASPVSGTDLGRSLGMSKVAVWKHIHMLMREGYNITAAPTGYQLQDIPDIPDEYIITVPNVDIRHFRTLGSTMDAAREIPVTDSEYTLVTADTQREGRGRAGRDWPSPRGGIYATIACIPRYSVHRIASYSIIAAFAVMNALAYFGIRCCRFIWPGDISFQNRKIAGILLETEGETEKPGRCLIGIGINIRELEHAAASVNPDSEKKLLRSGIVKHIMKTFVELDREPGKTGAETALSGLLKLSPDIIGMRMNILQDGIPGEINALFSDGSIKVSTDQGEHILFPGDLYSL